MRFILSAIAVVLFAFPSIGWAQSPVFGPHWVEHSKQGGVFLVQPDDYDFVPVVENDVMAYDLALRHSSGRVEARWSVQPIAAGEIPSPAIHLTALTANVSDAVMSEMQVFPTADVGRDYYAHWGALTVIKPRPAFGGDYSFAVLVGLHRDAKAMVYGVFLCKDLEADMPLMSAAFPALKFKDALEAPPTAPAESTETPASE